MSTALIATWNVNSVNVRLPQLLAWLTHHQPDIVLLQEIKCQSDAFPRAAIEEMGYNVAVHGQKTYNGVAILSRTPIEDIITEFPNQPLPEQARYIEAVIGLSKECVVRVASIYVPNGFSPDSSKFTYKMEFLEALTAHTDRLLRYEEPMILGGDYNIAPEAIDVYDPIGLQGNIGFHPAEHTRYRTLMNLGLHDAFRLLHPTVPGYSWWDYRAGSWQRDHGMRIDHLLLSPQAANRLTSATIDKNARAEQRASDHAPVMCGLLI
jgi:exodeoxyribonuclease-3